MPGNSMLDVKKTVTDHALALGFDLVRITSAEEFVEDRAVTLDRLRDGLMDGLPWYHEARVLRGTTPQELLPGARSIICLGLNYYQNDYPELVTDGPVGRVARYAHLQDYHKVMKKRMREYVDGLSHRLQMPIAARWYVDDGPMLDRAAAARSGLGWFGKSTNILTSSHGSWIFLGQVVTDLEIEPDAPLRKTCGACVRCIDACPTGAIVAPYVIDNTRCISYLTIENRGPIPMEFRSQMQDWVFGCDICQDVCPVNRKAVPANPGVWQDNSSPAGQPTDGWKPQNEQRDRLDVLDLIELVELSEEEFRRRFKGTAILRAKLEGLQRNACVALGNWADPAAVPALCRALANGEPLVRGHSAWALGRIGTEEVRRALELALSGDNDPAVLAEIRAALDNLRGLGTGPGGL